MLFGLLFTGGCLSMTTSSVSSGGGGGRSSSGMALGFWNDSRRTHSACFFWLIIEQVICQENSMALNIKLSTEDFDLI